MAVASTAPAPVRVPENLPRSRSRAGRDAGSSDQDDRRAPRTLGPARELPNPELLATATATLAAQRSFRIEQLLELGSSSPDPAVDPGRAQVHVALRDAARSALRDIDAALRRIQQGSYGRCPNCGDTMSTDRLRDLPMAPKCGRCQRATHRGAQRRADETVPMVGVAPEAAHRGRGDVRPRAETAATAVRRRRGFDRQPASRRLTGLGRDDIAVR
jgi:DnaK suppressor protein